MASIRFAGKKSLFYCIFPVIVFIPTSPYFQTWTILNQIPFQTSNLSTPNFNGRHPILWNLIEVLIGDEIYTMFDEESESEVENREILHLDLEIKEEL